MREVKQSSDHIEISGITSFLLSPFCQRKQVAIINLWIILVVGPENLELPPPRKFGYPPTILSYKQPLFYSVKLICLDPVTINSRYHLLSLFVMPFTKL